MTAITAKELGIDAICTRHDSLYHDCFLPAWELLDRLPLAIVIDVTCLSEDELAAEFNGDLPAVDGFESHRKYGRCLCSTRVVEEIAGRKVLTLEFETAGKRDD